MLFLRNEETDHVIGLVEGRVFARDMFAVMVLGLFLSACFEVLSIMASLVERMFQSHKRSAIRRSRMESHKPYFLLHKSSRRSCIMLLEACTQKKHQVSK